MTITPDEWAAAKKVFRSTLLSSSHFAIASRNEDGSAHVTPIGSVLLTDVGHGIYFDMFNHQLSRNVDADPRVTILAVDSSKALLLRWAISSRFARPPGLRLAGTVGKRRPSSPGEVARFRRTVGPLRHLPGAKKLWGDLSKVRDLNIDRLITLSLGSMYPGHEFPAATTPELAADHKAGGPGH